jgi:hypothetical protein
MAIAATVLGVAATWAIADVSPGSAVTPSGTPSVAFDDDSSSDDNRNRGVFGNRRSSRNRDIIDVILGRDVRINGSDDDSDSENSDDEGWNDSQRVRRNDRGGIILRDGSVVIDRDGRVILRPSRN